MRRLLYILLVATAFACSPSRSVLTEIAETITEDPGSALQALEDMDTAVLDEAGRAEYTLLYMEAEVGTYGTVIVTTDEDVNAAGEYFLRAGDDAKVGRMWAAVAKAQYGEGNFKASSESYATAVDMFESRSAAMSDRLDAVRLRQFVLILFIFIISVIGYNFYRLQKLDAARRIEEERAEREHVMTIAEELQEKLKNAGSGGKVSEGFSVLERLCEQYYVYEGTENLQPRILKEVKTLIEGLRQDTAKIENMLDRNENGLMLKFREQCKGLKEDDVKLFAFVAAGFSSTAISTLMEKDKQYIYNRIYRLKGKLSASDAPDKELFLKYLTK